MVNPGFKTRLFTLALAATAEILRWKGIIGWGMEEVYAYIRPALDDILWFLSEEDYIRLMMMIRDTKQEFYNWIDRNLPTTIRNFLRNLF